MFVGLLWARIGQKPSIVAALQTTPVLAVVTETRGYRPSCSDPLSQPSSSSSPLGSSDFQFGSFNKGQQPNLVSSLAVNVRTKRN